MPHTGIRTTTHDHPPPAPPRAAFAAGQAERDAVVRAVREHLEAHCTRGVTLAELARLTGFSQFHLCRFFRDAVGLPPYAYLLRARLARARRMIAAGEALSTVAYETGFSDQSHLTRHFKRAFGVTPGQYGRSLPPSSVDAESRRRSA